MLPWDESSEGLLARLRCARDWLPDEAWPAMDEESLLADLEQWLLPAVSGMTRLEQLKRLDMSDILRQSCPGPCQGGWTRRCRATSPHRPAAGYGSATSRGQAPAIPVRIQEMFGLGATPCVADGRVPWWWSCSPGPAPLQITADLAAFWAGSYEQVKKEMKGATPSLLAGQPAGGDADQGDQEEDGIAGVADGTVIGRYDQNKMAVAQSPPQQASQAARISGMARRTTRGFMATQRRKRTPKKAAPKRTIWRTLFWLGFKLSWWWRPSWWCLASISTPRCASASTARSGSCR